MRILTSILLLFISLFVAAQEKTQLLQKDKWQRVYTYEDSIIEVNTTKVILVNNDIGRVEFRTVYSKPQKMREKPEISYKTRLETFEYRCAESRYRRYQVTLLDSKGKVVDSLEMDQNEGWKTVRPDGIMEKMLGFGCRLVSSNKGTEKPVENTETTGRPVLRRRP